MTHKSLNSTEKSKASIPLIAQLLEQGIDRCTSDSWTVKAIDTRPQTYSESDRLIFEAIVQHERGDTIQVKPVPAEGQSNDGYEGTMRVALQRADGADGEYVRLQGRAASLNPDRTIARTLLFYANGVDHPAIDQWTGFETMQTVHVADEKARAVTYPSLTEVLIAVIGAARSVPSQQTQADLSAFA